MCRVNLTSEDKKLYGKEVGEILVKNHGKQKYYSADQVKQASLQSRHDIDWHCWAMCLFLSPIDFQNYHDSIGEACDYEGMRSEMTLAMTDGISDAWFDLDLSWLDWPEIDLSSIFDFS